MTHGGIHALKGFVYQATVILDVLLPFFESHPTALACPEGVDDLDLVLGEGEHQIREYLQIKKPREDDSGNIKGESWSLREIVLDLLPHALRHLQGNDNCLQRWILGDNVDAEVRTFVEAGRDAPRLAHDAYLHAIHLLAREASHVTEGIAHDKRASLGHWRYHKHSDGSHDEAFAEMVSAYTGLLDPLGVDKSKIKSYQDLAAEFHTKLPDALSRIRLNSTFGSDEEIRGRVCEVFSQTYPIAKQRVVDTVFANLRMFIDDIAVKRGVWIDRNMLDELVARVWPELMLLREPPPLPDPFISRDHFLNAMVGTIPSPALEVVGVSGSGKTSFARMLYDHLQTSRPGTNVFYAQVNRHTSLRGVLASVAFYLAKRGDPAMRNAVERSNITEEERVGDTARALQTLSTPTVVLLDLVEGNCDDEFARLIAIFLAAIATPQFTLVVLGQESALRNLTSLERQLQRIPAAFEQGGFHFEEFLDLVEHFHGKVDRPRLWTIYERVSAGRAAGVFARLAYDMARASSMDAIERIATAPPDQVVPRAIRERFSLLPPSIQAAAGYLVCFMLPFRKADAATVFLDQPIGTAIEKLAEIGLLQHHDSERFEMHETVRRSIESGIALGQKQEAHKLLAYWYRDKSNLLAWIHHLDCAEQKTEAHQVAREEFLNGKHAFELAHYVSEHRLFNSEELSKMVLETTDSRIGNLAPRLLRQVGNAVAAKMLLREAKAQSKRFDTDYQWAWRVTESILVCDPSLIQELALFGLAERQDTEGRPIRFEYVVQGARRAGIQVDEKLLDLFQTQDAGGKRRLVDLLVLDPRRNVLEVIFSFLALEDVSDTESGSREEGISSLRLGLRSKDEIVAFLGALPLPETSAMVIARGHDLGKFANLVWSKRDELRPICVELLETEHTDDTVLENALRVLMALGAINVVSLSEKYRDRKSRLGALASFMPGLLPEQANLQSHEARLLDPTADINERLRDLTVLHAATSNLGALIQALRSADPAQRPLWDFVLLSQALSRPSREAIPLLNAELDRASDESIALLAPPLFKLGELPVPEATDMLVRALAHRAFHVRNFACMALQTRRSSRALDALLSMLKKESEPQLVQMGVIAMLASGPTATTGDAGFWRVAPSGNLWRCILAGRLRDNSELERIVDLAIDQKTHWQVRRAAILSASKYPYDSALARIADRVLAEHSPFGADKSHSLLGHQALCSILMDPDEDEMPLFKQYGAQYVWQAWYDGFMKTAISGDEAPNGKDAIAWVFQMLSLHNPPQMQRLIDQLHVPILHAAVLRGLRLTGQRDRIAAIAKSADTEWLTLRACCEYGKGQDVPEDLAADLQKIVSASQFPESPYLRNVVSNSSDRAKPRRTEHSEASGAKPTIVDAHAILNDLTSGRLVLPRPFQISSTSASDFKALIDELDPARDHTPHMLPTEPAISFGAGGVTVQGLRTSDRSNQAEIRGDLRPAVAAANRIGVTIPWHRTLLSEGKYLFAFLKQLSALGDADRLHQELSFNSELIVPHLDNANLLNPILRLVDARVVPVLARYVRVGTDGLLESLCVLAGRVDDPTIDSVLTKLLQRWCRRFDQRAKQSQHDDNPQLWRALNALSNHGRFTQIVDYDLRLMEVLQQPIRWFHKNDIVRIVSKSRRSYIRLETMLFKADPFEHFHTDEVDRLDDAADSLFRNTDET